MNETEAKIYEFFQQRRVHLGDRDESIVACNYVEQGLLDSVGIVDFVLYIEAAFDVQFGPEEMVSEALFRISTTASLVRSLQSGSGMSREAA